MWFFSDFWGYFITVVLGYVILTTFARKIYTLLLPYGEYNVLSEMRITEITNTEECAKACVMIKSHCKDLSALGFDCEWVTENSIQKPVALLQLATVHGLCFLFRLNQLEFIPSALAEILRNPEIIKLGVSPLLDAKLLERDYHIKVCSSLDLRYLFSTDGSLAALAAKEINVKLNKNSYITCSDWEAYELSEAQKFYAAQDVYVAIEMFKKWLLIKNKMHFGQVNFSTLLNEKIKLEINKFKDVEFRPNFINNTRKQSDSKTILRHTINSDTINKKENSYLASRKSPLYHNCFMHAPDGKLLCSCSRSKAQWYIVKDLAEILSNEPLSIKLKFEPAARTNEGEEGGKFIQQLKQNCCVVCGALELYLRHHVVPNEYRKHFPKIMKHHQSHDIVLMCVNCHFKASKHYEIFKQKLALLCNAPLTQSKVLCQHEAKKVKNSANALLNLAHVIPYDRQVQLENNIKEFYKVDTLPESLLREAAKLEWGILNPNYESHGIKVVNYFTNQAGGLATLEILWRKYFLKKMNPKYMPSFWSVTHNHSRLTLEAHKSNKFSDSLDKKI